MARIDRSKTLLTGLAWLLCATACPAADEPPLPPPWAGETRVLEEQQVINQFAPPLALPDGGTLLFQADGDQPVLWRVFPAQPDRGSRTPITGVKIETGAFGGLESHRPARHASVATSAGIWLIGPTVHLIKPSGPWLSTRLTQPRHDARAVALPDGSVMVIGGDAWPETPDAQATLKVDRVWLDRDGELRSESLAPLPVRLSERRWDGLRRFSALHLGAGRVMVAGTQRRVPLLYDHAAKAWSTLPTMLAPRDEPALVLLPDGRVWATGGIDRAASTSSELWDPAQQAWQRGPALPVPMQEHQATWVADEGAVLLGAGRLPTLLSWRPGDEHVHIAGRMSLPRRGGALMPLPGRRVAIVSGITARSYGEAWGRRSPGASIATWTTSSVTPGPGSWQVTRGGALDMAGARLLAVGGTMLHTHEGSEAHEATRLVEVTDLATGDVTAHPVLPAHLARAEAAWLDERQALVLGETIESDASVSLRLLDTSSGQVRDLGEPGIDRRLLSSDRGGRLHLIGAHNGQGWLVGDDGGVNWVDAQGQLSMGPRLQRRRTGLVGRVLQDGRVVVAGGEVEGEWVASRPGDCAKCAVEYVGWGKRLPSRRHEVFDPVSRTWSSSAPSRGVGGVPAILPNGRVIKPSLLSHAEERPKGSGRYETRQWVALELSAPDGTSWRTLPWPLGVPVVDDLSRVRVLAPLGEGAPFPHALFLGVREFWGGVMRWWWLPSVDTDQPAWWDLGTAVSPFFFPPGPIPLTAEDGQGDLGFALGSEAGVAVYPHGR